MDHRNYFGADHINHLKDKIIAFLPGLRMNEDKKSDLKGKKVAIIGFARSGMALAELIFRVKGNVRISDSGEYEKIRPLFETWSLKDKVEKEFGVHTPAFIKKSDLILLSPGVRIDSPVVEWAREEQIPVMGEIEFAWRYCPSPVVAITGTNGKTTVTTLVAKILEEAGRTVCLCGNIGSPLSKHVLDLTRDHTVVLEISSFQLESIIDFRPDIAVLLNFSQNHLDRHKNMEEYFQAKVRIFENQTPKDHALLDGRNPLLQDLARRLKAQVHFFNALEKSKDVLMKNPNFLAALEVGRILGIDDQISLSVIRSFKGVEHRLELVRTWQGVDFINDSKATTPEAGRWALESIQKPIVMITGGKNKNTDFSVLRGLVKDKVRKMFTIGEAKKNIKEVFGDLVDVRMAGSLEDAVAAAQKTAREGDCVVLCPMCASFDMFRDYEQRGRMFKELVNKL